MNTLSENSYETEIKTYIDQAQDSTACHQKYAMLTKQIFDKYDTAVTVFIAILKRVLVCDCKVKNIFIERIIQFIATVCSSLKPTTPNGTTMENPTLLKIFDFLLESQCLSNDSVRYWSCKIISKVFENADEISDELFMRIKNTMLDRVKDPIASIRCQAIISIYKLQDPKDNDDPITECLLDGLQSDPNGKVRQLFVEKIAITRKVLPHIITRARDVDFNVRLTAYKRLTDLAVYLTIVQKRILLRCGFLDVSDVVKSYVAGDLLLNWLEHYENDCLKLIRSLRLDASKKDIEETTKLVELVLNAVFKKKSLVEVAHGIEINQNKLIDCEKLNWESAIYWRVLVEYLRQSEEFEQVLDSVIPDLIYLCKHIERYQEFASNKESEIDPEERNFVLKQLFLITKGSDVSDSATRKCLNLLVRHVLEKAELSLDTAEIIVRNLEATIPNSDQRSQFVCEIISDIMYPFDQKEYNDTISERNFQLSKIKTELNIMHEDQEKAVSERKFLEAERINQEIENLEAQLRDIQRAPVKSEIEKTTDNTLISKYLNVAEALLKSPKITSLTPALQTLKCDVIQEVLMHDDDDIKAKAFRCYALCSIVDINTAKSGIHIFSTPIFAYHEGEECNMQILIACIHAVIDLLRIYGSSLIAEPNDEVNDSRAEEHVRIFTGGTSLTDLVQGLVDLMDSEDLEIQESATQGLCSLLSNNRVHSPSLIARLVLKWSNPATDEELKQFIGLTLNILPTLPDCARYFVDAFVLTIKTLVYAPKSSPLADVDVDNIAKFMLILCQISAEGTQLHTDIAFTICDQIKEKPRAKVNTVYSKMLLHLNLSHNDLCAEKLKRICDELRDDVRDRPVSNNLVKFSTALHKIISASKPLESIEE